ncbi:MAG: hypothetical protein ACFFC6_05175 [Promethearchaeota archaeon]
MKELEQIKKETHNTFEKIKSWDGHLTAKPCSNIACKYYEEEKQYYGIATFEDLPPINLCLKIQYGKLRPHICWLRDSIAEDFQ